MIMWWNDFVIACGVFAAITLMSLFTIFVSIRNVRKEIKRQKGRR